MLSSSCVHQIFIFRVMTGGGDKKLKSRRKLKHIKRFLLFFGEDACFSTFFIKILSPKLLARYEKHVFGATWQGTESFSIFYHLIKRHSTFFTFLSGWLTRWSFNSFSLVAGAENCRILMIRLATFTFITISGRSPWKSRFLVEAH